MDFGLGLILSLTDNATAGINNAVNSLDRLTQVAGKASTSLDQMASLSALSVVSGQLGNSFTTMGSNIISSLSQVIDSVNETGQTLMYAEKQLDALYASSGKTGLEVIGQIQQYAKESMFDFENLIPAVTSLKSVGIEAFDAITSSTGDASHSLLDYASALASFAPQMKNAYGTGVNAAIGAMREYIAEGNAMSLKRGAGLDITGILGEDKGATIEERTRQVADLVEQLGMLGMVDAMKDSARVKLSNMGDTLFQLKGWISDSDIGGVSTIIGEIVDVFYNFVTAISDERLKTIAKNIGGALVSILKPVKELSKKIVELAEGFVNLLENNPSIVKFITLGGALVGVLLVLAGVALKFTSAFSGVSLMILASGKSLKQIGGLFKSGAIKMMGVLLPLIATFSMLYLAWKSDFLGIRTNVTSFVSNLKMSFKTAKDAVRGDVSDLTSTMDDLNKKGDFFSNLTLGVMKLVGLFDILKDAWSDNTISEEMYEKMQALGIEPLVNSILDLKYRLEHLVRGFKDGWKQISESVGQGVANILSNIKGTPLEGFFNAMADFIGLLASGDAQSWYEFGQFLSSLTAILTSVFVAVKLFSGVAGIFTTIFNVVKTVVSVFGFLKGVVVGVLTAIGTVVASVLSLPATIPAAVIGAITVALVAIVALIVKYRDKIFGVLKTIGSFIMDNIISPIADVITGFLKGAITALLSFVAGIINGVIYAINGAIGLINKIPGVNISKIEYVNLPKLAEGGIVSSPTQALIGEAGTEAVVPLENNTGWLSKIASMLVEEMQEVRPTAPTVSRTPNNQGGQRYLTTNNSTTQTVHGDTDNSVVIQSGAIQINVQKATDEEAQRLAKKIMEYIKRQQQLDRMTSYA